MRAMISKIRSVSLLLAVGIVLLCVLLPASVSAGGPQMDVCGTGGGAGACNSFIAKYVNPAVIALTALVGIAAVASIIVAGIQYASSADDAGAVTKAKQRIFNTILGLVAYIFLLAFLNYLVPGGFF